MALDPHALYRRANEILEAMPPDDRSDQDRINESAWLARQELADNGAGPTNARIVTAQDFVAVDEPGADPLVGAGSESLIPIGGDVMFYGDGGSSKTTLSIDLAVHLAEPCAFGRRRSTAGWRSPNAVASGCPDKWPGSA